MQKLQKHSPEKFHGSLSESIEFMKMISGNLKTCLGNTFLDMIEREPTSSLSLHVIDGGEEKEVDFHEYIQEKGIDGIIKIQGFEYDTLQNNTTYYGHYNFEISRHLAGNVYILPKIIKQGYYDNKTKQYVSPLLDMDNAIKAKCLYVKEYIDYQKLKEWHFLKSNSKKVESLKKEIKEKYSHILKNMKDIDEFYSKGISFTLLEKID